MLRWWIFIILSFFYSKASCSNVTINFDEIVRNMKDPYYGVTWMYFPDGNGVPQIANLTDPGSVRQLDPFSDEQSDVTYFLYRANFRNQPIKFRMNDGTFLETLENNENFDPGKKTKIIIHGWKNTYQSPIGQKIKNAYLNKEDMNVFVVDWGEMADDHFYFRSVSYTRTVGKRTASLIDYMVAERGLNLKDLHIVGHSLGAQTSGFTGKYMRSGKVGRITGLDPARPGFTTNDPASRLHRNDAEFVDVIHTCAGMLGSEENLGHADFWPNGGSITQPGCNPVNDITGSCSHGRSYEYFTESIDSDVPFRAYPCDSYDNFKRGRCVSNPTRMGEPTPNNIIGTYYLITRERTPYALIWKQ